MKGINKTLELLFFNRYNYFKGSPVISLLIAFALVISFVSADTGYGGGDLPASHYYKTSGGHTAGHVLASSHFIKEFWDIENEENDFENDYGISPGFLCNKKISFFKSQFNRQLNNLLPHTEYYILYCCLKIHLPLS